MSIDVNVQNDLVIVTESSEDITVNVSNAAGPAGVGVPTGGSTGQVLKKASATNYDTYWAVEGGGVPYTGATGDVNLGEFALSAGQVTLDTTPTGTASVGTTRWNDTIGSSETTLKGGNVVLKNGVDLVARVVNKVSPNTTLTKANYQAVKISGAQGQRLAVALAQANNDANSADTIGLVTETIATNQEGFIMTVGNLEGINTTGSLQGETWADGDVLYLSPTTAGALTNIKPTGATGHIVVVGYVEYAHANNGKIYCKIMNGWELDELHNVYITSPANNDALIYESATSLWKNKTIDTALGYTPVPTTRTLTINGTAYDLSADRSWTVSAAANTIYTADGTLAGDRTITSNGNSLTILGGIEATAGEQRGLILQTSTTSKSSIELLLNNTFTTTGKTWRLRSLSGGDFDIVSGASRYFYIGTDGKVVINGNSAISSAQFSVSGNIATNSGIQIQGDIVSPLGAGIELVYSGGTSYFTSYNRTGSTWLPIVIRGSQIDFTTNGSNTSRFTAAGRLLLGTTTESTFIFDAVGSARITGNLNLNATASSWSGGFKVIEMQGGATIASFTSTPSAQILTNLYNDGLGLIRISATFGTRYYQLSGQHVFEVTGSGSAGSSATMNTAMTLTNAGRLLLGTVSESTFLLDVNGTARVSGQLRLGTTSNFANITGVNVLSNNIYFDGSNVSKYITSNVASAYLQVSDGRHLWQQAPSGTADTTASFSTKMEIFANGRLATGGASDYGALVNMLGTTSDALQIGNANYLKFGGQASGTQYIKAFETDFTIGNAFSGGSLILMSGNTNRVTIKSNGSVNYTPMATPGTASAGDVYYDSTSNKLRCYNGSTWNDLF